jgi:hypothetical protein
VLTASRRKDNQHATKCCTQPRLADFCEHGTETSAFMKEFRDHLAIIRFSGSILRHGVSNLLLSLNGN